MDMVVKLAGCEFSARECSSVYFLRERSLANPCSYANFRSIDKEVNWMW